MPADIVILAAGQGTRMRSDLPKVLQPLAGRPLLDHVVDAALAAGADRIHVVYGFGGDQVRAALACRDVDWVEQAEQLGTGHAVAQALPGIADGQIVVVLCGDVPLIRPETIHRLAASAAPDGLALLTAVVDDPTGYGRIVRRADGRIDRVVEQKDASPEELAIREINTGLVAASAARLRDWLGRVQNDNAQGEYYLTDIVGLAVADGVHVVGETAASLEEVAGINDKCQLAAAEASVRRARAAALMTAGVTLADPTRVDIRGRVTPGRDVFIDVGVILEGDVTLGDRVHICNGAVIRDSVIAEDARILPYSLLDQADVGPRCSVGPFARLRHGARLPADARVGNFVEVKNSDIGPGSKASHLTYLGDTTVGRDTNIGAGTITCNYDGANKHRTIIGDRAFIGSGVELVAPVEVGDDATIGAGSTIGKPAPPGKLTVARSRQITINGWQRPQKKKP
jgi:bifunctional UDP-N-acetylglucosamine pyrophosphorylase/glucosamine-1-phosphate N-acetyltransferase